MEQRPGTYAEFEAFVAGAAGRLLRVAMLLTAEPETGPAETARTEAVQAGTGPAGTGPSPESGPTGTSEPGAGAPAAGRTGATAAGAPADAPAARVLLGRALARTYANWQRLRGDDPYDYTRQQLCAAFARTGRRHHGGSGVLARLGPLERLVVVMRIYEGVAEEVTAAQLGLPPERVRALCNRAVAELRPRNPQGAPGQHGAQRPREAA